MAPRKFICWICVFLILKRKRGFSSSCGVACKNSMWSYTLLFSFQLDRMIFERNLSGREFVLPVVCFEYITSEMPCPLSEMFQVARFVVFVFC